MMKTFTLNACAFLCLSISAYAEIKLGRNGSVGTQQDEAKEVSLREALTRITKEFGVKFTYERAVVEKIKVRYDWTVIKTKTAQEVVESVLTSSGLTYKAIQGNYYIITRTKIAGTSVENDPAAEQITITVSQPALAAKEDTTINPKTTGKPMLTLTGTVSEKGTLKPMEGASVSLTEYGLFTISDSKGSFTFRQVPEGKVTLLVQSVSMIPFSREIILQKGKISYVDVQLEANVLSLKDIEVVATENKSGPTSSNISRKAIEHLQATSLGDVMQLLPGSVTVNPDFSKVNRFSIRQIPDGDDDVTGNLGTAVIVNGAPVSNNGNVQSLSTATSGTAGARFATSTAGGTDLRTINADNIESIEVIRGIPSVEYGDLTSGAIIVKTKAGKEPLNIKARINPKLTQFWIGKGLGLGTNGGVLNFDVDYTNSADDQRLQYKSFERLTGSLLYTKKFFKSKPLVTTTGFSYSMNLDNEKQDPDDKRFQARNKAQNYSYRFTTEGKLSLQKKFSRSLNYNIAVDYAVQNGYQQQLLSGSIYPLSTATENATQPGQFVPSEYLSIMNIEGRPLNLFAKITNSFFANTGTVRHKILAGTEWRTDVNFGKGRIYDVNRPPVLLGSNATRPRSFKDIPALNQFSLYAEDILSTNIAGKNATLQAGIRFDNIQPTGIWNSKTGTVLSPRLNFSYELVNNFSVHLGYGVTAKSPTLLYLYPDNAYFDLININYFATNPAERLVVITTRKFNSENPDLKIAKNAKKEIGFDYAFSPGKRISITAFYEKTKNGYDIRTSLNSIKMVPLEIYEVASTPAGQPPVLKDQPLRVDTFIADYNMPTNDNIRINKGIELDLDLGRFDNIRTSFVLNGAWINSKSIYAGYDFYKYQNAGKDPSKMAIFAAEGEINERTSTTLRAIHNVPEVRLVITLSAQTIWSEKQSYLGTDSIAIGYIRRKDSQIVWLNEGDRKKITKREDDPELFQPRVINRFVTDSYNPIWLFNLRLTKEIGKHVGFSFFANNVFMNRKQQAGTRYPNEFALRNPTLFFGTELNIRL